MKKVALLSRLKRSACALGLGALLGLGGLPAAFADSYQVGLSLYAQGDYLTASRYFLQAVGENQNNPNAHYYLADSYLKLNRLSEAQAEYQKILAMAPNSQAARFSRLGLTNLRDYLDNVNGERWRKAGGTGPGALKDSYSGEPVAGDDYLELVLEGGRRVRWALPKMPLNVYIEQTPLNIRNFQPGFVAQVRKGLDVWCRVLNNQLSYRQVSRKEDADIRVSWVNTIDTQGHNGDGGTAYTAGLMVPHLRDDQIQYMDVKIATFDIEGKPQNPDIIYAVAIHELGHSLGLLGHSDNAGDIMFAQNQHIIQPSRRDMNTIRNLYTLAADVNNLPASEHQVDPNRAQELAKAEDEGVIRAEREAKANGSSLSYLNLGVAYYQKAKSLVGQGGDASEWYQKALKASSTAIQMEPKDPRAYHKRSLVYQELSRFDLALQDIQKSVLYDRNEPEYLMLQSWFLAKVGRYAEARGSLDAYLLAKPAEANSPDVQKIREELASSKK